MNQINLIFQGRRSCSQILHQAPAGKCPAVTITQRLDPKCSSRCQTSARGTSSAGAASSTGGGTDVIQSGCGRRGPEFSATCQHLAQSGEFRHVCQVLNDVNKTD